LLALPVEQGLQLEVRGVYLRLDPRPQGGEGIKALGPGPLSILALQIPGSHVVKAGVAQNKLISPFFRNPLCQLPDHDAQFSFIVHPPCNGRVDDWIQMADDGRGRL